MRVAHFTNHCLFLGGGERLGLNWIENSKHDSHYYSKHGGIHYTKNKAFHTYKDSSELAQLAQKHRDSVVVLHDPLIAENSAFEVCSRLIWFVHGAFTFRRDISGVNLPKVVISNYLPKETHPSWRAVSIIAVPLGVSAEDFFAPSEILPFSKLRVGIVGRLSAEKIPLYFFDFIEKFNRSRSGYKRFEFQFYGKGLEESFLVPFRARVASISNVLELGAIPIDKIREVYQQLDILLVPSLSETGSYAIVEAQLCGLRVIAMDVDGIPTHVCGSSMLVSNYDGMFAALSNIRRDKLTERNAQSKAAQEKFNLKRWADKLDCMIDFASI